MERFDIEISGVKGVRLRKTNRIKTIHGSTAIFGKWRSAFYAAPIAHIVWENQSGYYLAIRRSTLLGNSELFIDFMIERILQAIKGKGEELKNVGVNVGVKLSARARDLLELLCLDGTLTFAPKSLVAPKSRPQHKWQLTQHLNKCYNYLQFNPNKEYTCYRYGIYRRRAFRPTAGRTG